MVIRNVTVNDCTPETIVIGRRGTFETMQIVFDLTYLIENYGDGTAVLALKRSQDSSAYPAVAAQDGNTLTWVVSEVDTYYVGAGVCQLMWYVDDGLAKTIIYPMVVMKDILSTAEEPPDGYENWIEHLTDLGAETLQNARDAAQSASDAESAKDDAVTAKEAAENAANRAETAASNAGNSASSAANSAGVATTKAAEASTSAQSASQSASSASGYAGSASASASSASESATSASNSASSASTSAQTATTKANEASSSASSAAGSAQTASEKAGQAATSATNASNSADQAAQSATAAGQSATNAAGSATTATTQAGIATTKAGEAAQSATAASEAQTAAETAQGKAEDAQEAAEAAQQAAEQAAQDVINKAPVIINSASGEIASFNDGADDMPVKSLVASIEPVQDLHGQDSPYPAGANTLFSFGASRSGYTWSDGCSFGDIEASDSSILLNGTASSNHSFSVPGASLVLPAGTYTISLTRYGVVAVGLTNDEKAIEIVDSAVTFTLSAQRSNNFSFTILAGASFNNEKLGIQINSGTTASPYANECPINGHTGCNVTRTGKNLLNPVLLNGYYDTANGNFVAASGWKACEKIKCNPDADYVMSGTTYATGSYSGAAVFWDANGNYIGERNSNRTYFHTYANAAWMAMYTGSNTLTDHMQIEEGQTPSVYEPYTGTTIPITFPTTIYGGSDEVIGGALKSTMGMVDLGTLNWSMSGASGRGLFKASLPGAVTDVNAFGVSICSLYKNVEGNGNTLYYGQDDCAYVINGMFLGADYPFIAIRDSAYSSATEAEFKAAMSGVQLCYELDQPVEYTLTANELTTLYGQNNVWTDVGEVSVDYPADTKLYIDNKIATAVANALNA